MDKMGYLKHELRLSGMPKDHLANCLEYSNSKVKIHFSAPHFYHNNSGVFCVIYFLFFCNCQGLIMSKALKAQKNAEDESTQIAFRNLRSEVISLQRQAEEKDNILISLVCKLKESRDELENFSEEENIKVLKLEDEKKASANRIAELESLLRTQAESHKSEMMKLKDKFDEVNKNFEVEKAKCEIGEGKHDRVKKMLMSFGNQRSKASLLLHSVVEN
jgi:hypothetical protein